MLPSGGFASRGCARPQMHCSQAVLQLRFIMGMCSNSSSGDEFVSRGINAPLGEVVFSNPSV